MPHTPSAARVPLVLGACLVAALSGCDVTIRDGDVSVDRLHGRATQEWNRKYPLEPGGLVEIANGNGGIVVTPGEAGAVAVTASLTARAMTDERAQAMLVDGWIEEAVSADRVRLTSRLGGRGDGRGRGRGDGRGGDGRRGGGPGGGGIEVNYKVTVPPDARLDITSGRGALKVTGLRGSVKAVVANGDVDLSGLTGAVDAGVVNGVIAARMTSVLEPLRLESTNGRIELELPRDSKAVLKALAVNGRITVSGLPSEEASDRPLRNLETTLNGGGPVIDLRVTNGRVSITGK